MPGKRGTPAERFWPKVDKRGPMLSPYLGPCWLWTASQDGGGYGYFRDHERRILAHRWVYRDVRGPIPEGLQIDHLCRNRACVNPAHLEAVTQRENLLRGDTIVAAYARKTHCPSGHRWDERNTYINPRGGGRECRECKRLFAAAKYRRAA